MNAQHISTHTAIVKKIARDLGFDFCGISKAEFLEEEAPRLENWLNKNMHGEMAYMVGHFDKRLDPRLLVDDAKSVVSLLFNYYPEQKQNPEAPQIAKYAYGRDYHEVIRKKLKDFLAHLNKEIGEINGRGFVDSAPVLERAWAKKSGLGWVGKNTNLIHKGNGSFYFIAQLIIDLELVPDGPVTDHCGSCTRCMDACPTDAIVEPYKVDGSKCISYFTIELKDNIPEEQRGKFANWAFGCDICQDVCPWNRFSKAHAHPELKANKKLLSMNQKEWYEITEDIFRQEFKQLPLSRSKFKGLQRNLAFIKKTS